MTAIDVEGYVLDDQRRYHPETHLWVDRLPSGLVRIGLDPLGVETSGSLAQLELGAVGTTVRRGDPLGTMEAEKFVGPLLSPLSGRISAVNLDVIADPRLVHRDPFEAWLVELDAERFDEESAALVGGEDGIRRWFSARLADYRERGVLAE